MNDKFPTLSEKFLAKYREMEKDFTNEDELFEAVAKAMEEDRALSQEERAAAKAEEGTSSMASMFKSAVKQEAIKFKLQDILQEKEPEK